MQSTTSRRHRLWIYLVEVSTVLGLLVALAAWLLPRDTAENRGNPGSPDRTGSATLPAAPAGSAPSTGLAATPPGGGEPLDATLQPDEGAANLGPLPKALAADPWRSG